MAQRSKQELVDQEAKNAQTLVFVADRDAEIASQADALAKEQPGFAGVAAEVREHRKTLMEVAAEEKQLATDIQFKEAAPETLAAMQREHRKDLLEIARQEGELAGQLKAARDDDGTAAVLAEQAERNRQLLRQVARTETEADRALRSE